MKLRLPAGVRPVLGPQTLALRTRGPAAPWGDAAGPRGRRQPLRPPWLHQQRTEPAEKPVLRKKW